MGLGASGPRVIADDRFPDPFCDVASLSMPESIQAALRWCEFIANCNGTYREAINRIVSYFLTDVQIVDSDGGDLSSDEKDKYLEVFEDTLGIKNVLHTVGMDYLIYGNSFTSLLVPFKRYISCPKCGFEMPLDVAYNNKNCKFRWENFTFNATCISCQYVGQWDHIDRRISDTKGLKVKRWNPHQIDLLWDEYSDNVRYIWKIPPDYKALIRQGDLHHLSSVSWEVVQAIKNDQNLMFDPDVIYHMREDALAGLRNRGWGISRVLANFRQAFYVQILQRYNEAVALDYVIPFRVITPAPRGGDNASSDPVHTINLSNFTARVQSMLRARRVDPARWNVLPFPVNYQSLGGDASQLAPKDLLDQGLDTLLRCIGMPVELYNGTLNMQAAPAALRVFEANWAHLPHNLNRFLAHLATGIAKVKSWEPASVKLMRVTHADDLNRQMAKLQLMMGQQISKTTGLKSVGLDFEEENKRQLEEERITAEQQDKIQKQMEQEQSMDSLSQQAGSPGGPGATGSGATGMPPGGDPNAAAAQGQPTDPNAAAAQGQPQPPMSPVDQFLMQRQNPPNIPRTPEDMQNQAQLLAQQILTLPEAQKDSQLIKLKKADPVMHALVSSMIEDIRQQAKTQGGAAVMQQQYGSNPSAQGPMPNAG